MNREIKFRAWDVENGVFATDYDTGGYSCVQFYDGKAEVFQLDLVDALVNGEHEQFEETTSLKDNVEIMQYTGLKDKNGVEIYFGDVLRFSDKWEWYRGQYGIKMMFADEERRKELQAQYEAELYEERVVENIQDYEWLLSGEIQSYWEVIGNIYESPELVNTLNQTEDK